MRSVIGSLGWMLAMLPVASMAAQAPPPDPFADPYREFCAVCHGANLEGIGPVPALAGRSPSYATRQLFDMKTGARRGPWGLSTPASTCSAPIMAPS